MYPGVDIVEIQRFSQAIERRPKLRERLFTGREIQDLHDKKIHSWAARFAGKEAVLKAMGTGLRGLSWHDIEIINNDLGEPVVFLSDKADNIVRSRGGNQIRVSLSHEREYAVGMAVLT